MHQVHFPLVGFGRNSEQFARDAAVIYESMSVTVGADRVGGYSDQLSETIKTLR